MKDGLLMRFGAAVLALLTLAAMVFALLNFQQSSRFVAPEDGITWIDGSQGVVAWYVAPDSPGARAGIREGDVVTAVNDRVVRRALNVTQDLWRVGPWAEVRYKIERAGVSIEVPEVTVPHENPSIQNYLRVTGLLYLFIGLFIFARRWSAPRAVHFYLFCLVSFIAFTFHYTGKLNSFDWVIYWGNVVALLLQSALLVHFALVFPQRRGSLWLKLTPVYLLPLGLLLLQIAVATASLDFVPSVQSRDLLDTLNILCNSVCF